MGKEDITRILSMITNDVKIVKHETIKKKMKEARRIMKGIDEKDSPFIATTLAVNADRIWSLDKDFLKQRKVRVITTKELYDNIIVK